MGLLNPHLDDDALAEVWAGRVTGDGGGHRSETHLLACAECQNRYAAFSGWLDGVRSDARAEADEAFTADRLAVQHSQINRRLEALEHPARVIAFPRFTRPIASRAGHRQRWVAGAAAAGLIAGIGLGQLFDLGGVRSTRAPEAVAVAQQVVRQSPAGERASMDIVPAASTANDEALVYGQEVVPSQVRVPESLQYLNAITPGARDGDVR